MWVWYWEGHWANGCGFGTGKISGVMDVRLLLGGEWANGCGSGTVGMSGLMGVGLVLGGE